MPTRATPLTTTTIHDQPATGIKRWLFATNHKDIGTMYLVFSLIMFFIGGSMAMVIRAELFQPGLQLVDPGFFNEMTTNHALIMIFGAVMPAFVGLANWMIPDADRRARHGAAAHEQFQLLDSAVRLHPAAVHAVRARRLGRRRLDPVSAPVRTDRRQLSHADLRRFT